MNSTGRTRAANHRKRNAENYCYDENTEKQLNSYTRLIERIGTDNDIGKILVSAYQEVLQKANERGLKK